MFYSDLHQYLSEENGEGFYSPTTGGPIKVATPWNEDMIHRCRCVIDNGRNYYDDDAFDDAFDVNNGDDDLDGNLEKEEKAKCIGEGVSTK